MLLMDLGNSRAKLAHRHATQEYVSIANSELSTEAILAACSDFGGVSEVVICSVRDKAFNDDFVAQLRRNDLTVTLLDWSDVEPYLSTIYDSRQSLGLDRQLAMLGARYYGQGPALVLDLGTASTIDALDADGVHLGGVIFPGLTLQREALLAGTEDISVKEDVDQVATFPLSTADAVFSGTLQAWRGGVLAIHSSMAAAMTGKVTTYVTGGQAPLLDVENNDSIFTELRMVFVPDLVLKGIQFLLERKE